MKRKIGSIIMLMLLVLVIAAACGNADNAVVTGTGNEAHHSENNAAHAENNADKNPVNDEAENEREEIVVTHDLGETTVPRNPQNVLVFDFGTLDSFDKLGVPVTGVPQANVPSYLDQYTADEYENIGSLFEPDFETISALDPELIVISGRQSDHYEELSRIGPTIFMGVDAADYMPSFTENMRTLGQIFEKEDEVEEELAQIDELVEDVHAFVTEQEANALVMLANDGNISVYGPGSRFGIVHEEFGFIPADDNIDASTHGMNVSFEYIAEQDPDYLLVIDRGAAVGGESSAEQMLDNELIENTRAYEEGRIVYLDPNYWYVSGGGLVSVSEMATELLDGLIKAE